MYSILKKMRGYIPDIRLTWEIVSKNITLERFFPLKVDFP